VTAFDQQLRAMVDAVCFTAPERARVTNLNGVQRDVAVAGERDAFDGLAVALYGEQYCLLPGTVSSPADTNGAAFLAALQAANPVVQRHQDGWTVIRADAQGIWLVDATQRQRFTMLTEVVPLANAIAPGLPVRLVPMREMVTGPAGHYVIFGRQGFDPQSGRQVRFYWNMAHDGAALFLREIGTRLERRRIPFQAKVPVDPARYARTDCGVLYLNDEDAEAARDAIAATYRVLRENLRPSTPLFTREIAPGLAFAESPPTRESFGMHRCGLVAEALLRAEQRGAREPGARLAILRERLIAYGLDLDRLERNPTSRYPYRLDALMEGQAA
jgi:hypothetical protein